MRIAARSLPRQKAFGLTGTLNQSTYMPTGHHAPSHQGRRVGVLTLTGMFCYHPRMELAKATALSHLTRDALRRIFFDKLDVVFLGFILFALILGGRRHARACYR